MKWIKDIDGDLINLNLVTAIVAAEGDAGEPWELVAQTEAGQYVLFIGDRLDVIDHRDSLFEDLRDSL